MKESVSRFSPTLRSSVVENPASYLNDFPLIWVLTWRVIYKVPGRQCKVTVNTSSVPSCWTNYQAQILNSCMFNYQLQKETSIFLTSFMKQMHPLFCEYCDSKEDSRVNWFCLSPLIKAFFYVQGFGWMMFQISENRTRTVKSVLYRWYVNKLSNKLRSQNYCCTQIKKSGPWMWTSIPNLTFSRGPTTNPDANRKKETFFTSGLAWVYMIILISWCRKLD